MRCSGGEDEVAGVPADDAAAGEDGDAPVIIHKEGYFCRIDPLSCCAEGLSSVEEGQAKAPDLLAEPMSVKLFAELPGF